MARYTCSVTVAVALETLYQTITEILKSCSLEVLIFREDYVMAREQPGQVPFTKLATVEVLVDSTRSTMHAADFELVVKNEELPLQSNNHCSQVYQEILKQSAAHQGWRLLTCSDPTVATTASTSPTPSAPPAPSSAKPEITHPPQQPHSPQPSEAPKTPPLAAAPIAPPASKMPPAPETSRPPTAKPSSPSNSSPQLDPSRFASLPKITPRASQSSPEQDTASAADLTSNGQTAPSNGHKLTWQPLKKKDLTATEPHQEPVDAWESETADETGRSDRNGHSPIRPLFPRRDSE